MSMKSQQEQMERVLALTRSGSKLMFFLGTFLLLVEVVTLFGASSGASRTVDAVSMVFTAALLFLSVVGVRVVSHVWRRFSIRDKEHQGL